MTERKILGIDPGTNIMGYGLISCKANSIELIKMDVIKLTKLETQTLKLTKIFESILELIVLYNPDEFAIEAPFYGKNVQSMLKLGRAQGVAMAAALTHSLPIFEYSPRKIKQSVTGNGNASKEQVASMLLTLLKIKESSKYLDATDALAVAVCHFFQKKTNIQGKSFSGWKSFISENPERLVK